jgi:hypothetical protein
MKKTRVFCQSSRVSFPYIHESNLLSLTLSLSLSLYKNQTAIPLKPEPAAHIYTQRFAKYSEISLSQEEKKTPTKLNSLTETETES